MTCILRCHKTVCKTHLPSMTHRRCPQLRTSKTEIILSTRRFRNLLIQRFAFSTCCSRAWPSFSTFLEDGLPATAKEKNSGANFITVTVLCILLLAADFWVVKNITGRLLVGLRWWNKVEGDKTTWIFESAQDRQVNKFDSSIFWTVLYATPVIWFGLMIIGILKFNLGWLIVVFTAEALSSANVYGYYKCSTDQKAKFQQMMAQGAQAGAMSVMRGNMVGWLTGASSTQQPQQQQTYV